jgi:hypothetical protein
LTVLAHGGGFEEPLHRDLERELRDQDNVSCNDPIIVSGTDLQ